MWPFTSKPNPPCDMGGLCEYEEFCHGYAGGLGDGLACVKCGDIL